jgi:uncharacterized membrane protein
MLGIIIFFCAAIAPLLAFLLYVVLKRQWSSRRAAPYVVGYVGAFSALLAWGMNLKGWDFLVAVGIGAGLGVLSTFSWGRLVDDLVRARRR